MEDNTNARGDKKTFLLDQKESLVQSIQSLVSSIRSNDPAASIRESTDDIAAIIGKVIGETHNAIYSLLSPSPLHDSLEPIVIALKESRIKLTTASVEAENLIGGEGWKEFANTLPPMAFPAAKQMTELVSAVQQMIEIEGPEEQ